MNTINNAKQLPQVYYGLHMVPGVAEYAAENGEKYRILVNETTCKEMDATFKGRPVYVQHVDKVNLDNLQMEADGYVVRSFYNEVDGKHWAEFIVVSDRGHKAIRDHWKLSNSYKPKRLGSSGEWHAVEYAKEILEGEYEHLAIVPNPRYEESIVLTAEEFKKYNEDKKADLKRLANSKETKSMFDFFKKTKVENSKDFEGMSVILPKSKKEFTLAQLVNEADECAMKKNDGMADLASKVKINDDEEAMSVGDLVAKHKKLNDDYNALKKSSEEAKAKTTEEVGSENGGDLHNMEEDEDALKKVKELGTHLEKDIEEGKKNDESSDEDADKKKKNEDKKEGDVEEKEVKEVKNAKIADVKHFNDLKDAPFKNANEPATIELMNDKVQRGVSRYGSGK